MENTSELRNIKSKKLYLRVYDEIREYILQNKLQPGDKLPTEMEMCHQLGVSRNVLREAIKSLEITGIVTSKPGVGIIIRECNMDYIMSSFISNLSVNNDSHMEEYVEELRRIHRSQNKALEGAPHEVLLVLDGTNGQNALAQVKAFDAAVKVTGLIITKLDGTAKGGVLAAICAMRAEAPLPIYFIGVGEQLADLQRFRAVPFANALVGLDPDYPETASSN